VTTFPQTGTVHAISTNGGTEPVWSLDGRELFYRHGPQVMVVQVESDVAFATGPPRVLFEGDFVFNVYQNWDITPDGQRFVMVEELSRPREIRIVPNWFDDLRRLVPAD